MSNSPRSTVPALRYGWATSGRAAISRVPDGVVLAVIWVTPPSPLTGTAGRTPIEYRSLPAGLSVTWSPVIRVIFCGPPGRPGNANVVTCGAAAGDAG